VAVSENEIVDTIYGKHNRYDVVRVKRALQPTHYIIRKNGEYHRGTFSRLDAAVEAARSDARKEG
jgi:hypothetical protein